MPIPYAQMGFVGSVRFNGGSIGQEIVVRAKSCDIRARQGIQFPSDIVDGRIDQTLYQIEPRIVEGSCEFPLVHEGIVNGTSKNCGEQQASCSTNLASRLWTIASKRDQVGRLANQFNIDVRYTDNTGYRYPSCIINTMKMNVTQGQSVNVGFSVIGGANSNGNVREALTSQRETVMLAPARIVTWNDFRINIFAREDSIVVPGSHIMEFDVNIDNRADRFYTFNGSLSPQDITARKREIKGSVGFLGFANKQFHDFVYNNQNRFTSQTKIQFGYSLGSATIPYWATALWGVIFKIEDVAISNDLIQTKMEYTALGDCENGYEAIEAGSCNVSVDSPNNSFGGPTSPNYFTPLN